MSIEELLPISSEFDELYWQKTNIGIEYAKDLNITFVGLTRNSEHTIEKSIKFLLDIPIFNSISLVVFENDSTDNTKKILLDLKNSYSNLHYLTQDFNAPFLPLSKSIDRTNALAKYRNICLQYVRDHLETNDYTVVIDLDFMEISINGIFNTFGWLSTQKIHAICGNYYQLKHVFNPELKTLWNYDNWAFRGNWWLDKQKESSNYDPMLWFGFWMPPVGSPIMPINSGFGGMTIYKTRSFLSSEYEGYDCEHVCFHKNLKRKISDFQLFLNPSQKMLSI